LSEEVARKFIGGRGLAVKLLYEGTPKGVDPFSPDNMLVFAAGPLADTPIPGASRMAVVAKSPLTGALGESYVGGSFGLHMRRAGFDAITIRGRSSEPVYVTIMNGNVDFHDASGVWGEEVRETNDAVRKDAGIDGTRVACIGPAGENLVRIANIMSEVTRAAGRCGLGAVMGSKNLKALAVHGDRKAKHADGGRLKEVAGVIRNKSDKPNMTKYGTGSAILKFDEMGRLPTRNYSERRFSEVKGLDPELKMKLVVRSNTCPGCTIRCRKEMQITDGRWAGVVPEYGSPEYETIGALGSNCMNSDIKAIGWLGQRCNALGIDTISMGGTFSMLMEATERGFVSEKEMRLEWGDTEGMARLLELTGLREGVGDAIAEGGAILAQRLGCPELSCNSKGLEVAMHEGRIMKALALGYATANRGATHNEVWFDPPFSREDAVPELGITEPVGATEYREKGRIAAIAGDFNSLQNSLVICYFNSSGMGPGRVNVENIEALSAATGWDFTVKEALTTGRRIYNLCRLFNVREGFGRKDDTIPYKLTQPTTTGDNPEEVVSVEDFEDMLDDFYSYRGWDSDGKPLPETLSELGLTEYSA